MKRRRRSALAALPARLSERAGESFAPTAPRLCSAACARPRIDWHRHLRHDSTAAAAAAGELSCLSGDMISVLDTPAPAGWLVARSDRGDAGSYRVPTYKIDVPRHHVCARACLHLQTTPQP